MAPYLTWLLSHSARRSRAHNLFFFHVLGSSLSIFSVSIINNTFIWNLFIYHIFIWNIFIYLRYFWNCFINLELNQRWLRECYEPNLDPRTLSRLSLGRAAFTLDTLGNSELAYPIVVEFCLSLIRNNFFDWVAPPRISGKQFTTVLTQTLLLCSHPRSSLDRTKLN